ncbi:glycosyltransferase family 2 protein [Prochlorococcus sp. MIT 1341]|uniref:glycosyltransferase n=1 Tax=Prochlorococcus sp. MIT 1341 TaxID=3096221 RepID=UPI002A74C386|nr:glycosyltransferase family 2 protein [Prochlorococcus sp. MIT 1341]
MKNAPSLIEYSELDSFENKTTLTVIVPTFNEEKNIYQCLSSIIESVNPCDDWKVIIADDSSSDQTLTKAKLASKKSSIRIDFLEAGPRPKNQRWVGKNWPCSQAMEKIDSDWILFLDADIQIKKETIFRALSQANMEGIDLLSLAPRLTCECLSEWMVQPIMASLISIGFPIKAANQSKESTAFAAGPFMLFRRSAYKAIGGHKDLAGEVVEDLALARKIKGSGFKLRFLLGLNAVDLHMYPDFDALWEGWSKNWFLGLDRNIPKAISASLVVFLIFSTPWLTLPSASICLLFITNYNLLLNIILVSLLAITLQLILRIWINKKFDFSLKYWWLMGAGGIIILFLGPISVVRTITGKGWTWKGRSLA